MGMICGATGMMGGVGQVLKSVGEGQQKNESRKGHQFPILAALQLILAIILAAFWQLPLRAQSMPPKYEVDANWPKPLPDHWVTGGVGGVCVDAKDHVFILNRRDLADNDYDAGQQAPPVMEFDPEGNLVNSWGDPNATPDSPHGCTFDRDLNIWLT